MTKTEEAIRAAVLDYAEGWFDGNVERMERCLHPELVKRALESDPVTGEKTLNHLTKEDMVRYTREGGGSDVPRDQIVIKVDIVEINREVAIVRCDSTVYVDYLQLINDGDQWFILNVLYITLNESQ